MKNYKTFGDIGFNYQNFYLNQRNIILPITTKFNQQEKGATDFSLIESNYYYELMNDLVKRINILEEKFENISESSPQISNATIYSLPVKAYGLTSPINVTLEFHKDDVIAVIPDLEIYGEGNNQIEAINDLKLELIDLYEQLNNEPDDKLGEHILSIKKTLNSLIKKCI